MEGHGAHLPINTDALIASHVADSLARRNNWISLPPITYTIAVPKRVGNVDISPNTLESYLGEILDHFTRFGQDEFIIVLGHGGPDMRKAIEHACSQLCKRKAIRILAFHISRILRKLSLIDRSTDKHAGTWETSFILMIDESLVGDLSIYKTEEDLIRYRVIGDPTKATKTLARKLLESVTNEIIETYRKNIRGCYF